MKVYRFKCEDCGSKKYEKLDENTYKCSYCGRVEEVYRTESEEISKLEYPLISAGSPLTSVYSDSPVLTVTESTFSISNFRRYKEMTLEEQVKAMLEALRPMLQQDGGEAVVIQDIQQNAVFQPEFKEQVQLVQRTDGAAFLGVEGHIAHQRVIHKA